MNVVDIVYKQKYFYIITKETIIIFPSTILKEKYKQIVALLEFSYNKKEKNKEKRERSSKSNLYFYWHFKN